MIDIYLLEQLDAFATCGTLLAAAKQLNLTQPTVSRSMQKLEEQFGVPLFTRTKKNRLSLNENGLRAAEYARQILRANEEMLRSVRMLDRSRRTITVGSCAPGPVYETIPLLSDLYPAMTLATEIAEEDTLLAGLDSGIYQMVILSHPVKDAGYHSVPCGSESLYMSVTKSHPFAKKKSVTFKEANGENFLMAAQVGIWEGVVRKHMPATRFLIQEGTDAIYEIAIRSSLPCFATDITLRVLGGRQNGIHLPFRDQDATLHFHCICLASEYHRYDAWWKMLEKNVTSEEPIPDLPL